MMLSVSSFPNNQYLLKILQNLNGYTDIYPTTPITLWVTRITPFYFFSNNCISATEKNDYNPKYIYLRDSSKDSFKRQCQKRSAKQLGA